MNMERSVKMFWSGEGGAVDIREAADYFLEVHRVMIVFACVLCICQGQDR